MHAEFLRIEVYMHDMNCPSCTETLTAAFKKMRGVDQVDVSMKDGTVTLALAARNRIGMEQVWDAIKRVGFTPGVTKVTVRGSVKGSKLEIAETGKAIDIEGRAPEGDNMELKGLITPPPDPRTPLKIRVAE